MAIETARPREASNQRPMAVMARCPNIPCPQKRNRKIKIPSMTTELEKLKPNAAMAKMSVMAGARRDRATLSAREPSQNISKAELRVAAV